MKKYVINMDQTPVFFTSHSKQTLEVRGVKIVTIHQTFKFQSLISLNILTLYMTLRQRKDFMTMVI